MFILFVLCLSLLQWLLTVNFGLALDFGFVRVCVFWCIVLVCGYLMIPGSFGVVLDVIIDVLFVCVLE